MAEEPLGRVARLLGLADAAIYGERTRLRQDDLLVRSRASASLGRAAAALRDLAARYSAERVPPSTREQPFPPAEAMGAMRRIERGQRAVQEVEVAVRSAGFPPEDAVWERLRSARLQLDTLLLLDLALIEQAEAVESLCTDCTLDRAAGEGMETALEDALAALRATLRERGALLAAPV